MSTHTIFLYDANRCKPVRIVMPTKPEHVNDVWLYVLRDRFKDLRDIPRDEVSYVLNQMGEDAMDYNIVAVVEGDVQSIFDSLPTTFEPVDDNG